MGCVVKPLCVVISKYSLGDSNIIYGAKYKYFMSLGFSRLSFVLLFSWEFDWYYYELILVFRNNAPHCFNYKLFLCSNIKKKNIKNVLFFSPQLRISSPQLSLGLAGIVWCLWWSRGSGFWHPPGAAGSFLLWFVSPKRVNFWGQGSLTWWHHTNFPCKENPKFSFFLPKPLIFTQLCRDLSAREEAEKRENITELFHSLQPKPFWEFNPKNSPGFYYAKF